MPQQQVPFSEAEQLGIDEASRAFIARYPDLEKVTAKQPFDAIAKINLMPETKITEITYEDVLKINKFRLEFDLWLRRVSPDPVVDPLGLTERQKQAVDSAGEELFGSKQFYFQWLQGVTDFTKIEQQSIDAAWRAYQAKYETLDDKMKIPVLATIEGMPETTITEG